MFGMLLLSAAAVFSAAARDDVRHLVTFDSAEKCREARFNSWAGEKKGTARWDADAKGLHLAWTNSTGCFILGNVFADAVRKQVAGASGDLRHVRLRLAANFFSGHQLYLKSFTSAGCYYDNPIGVDPNGREAVVLVRPGGFTKSKKEFDWRDLSTFFLYAPPTAAAIMSSVRCRSCSTRPRRHSPSRRSGLTSSRFSRSRACSVRARAADLSPSTPRRRGSATAQEAR